MVLSAGVKARAFLGSPLAWIGLLFGGAGLFMLLGTLPLVDFRSLRFLGTPLRQTQGCVTSLAETNYADNDIPIQAIHFRYRLAHQELTGQSFASALQVKPGEAVLVEYVADQPAYARIIGATNAPFALWVPVLLGAFVAIGVLLISKRVLFVQKIAAIVGDGFVTSATCDKVIRREKQSEDGSYTVYETWYSYVYARISYQHIADHSAPKQLGLQEPLIVQRSNPANAVLISDLPAPVRQLLPSPLC